MPPRSLPRTTSPPPSLPPAPVCGLACLPQVEVHVSATVFSPKKGHPALKPHVRCLGFAADADTEAASDWRGFE